MIRANFNAYGSYVTDGVNQWDLNHTLRVTGLNMTSAPEVHFSNANVDRAIVRQSTMTDHVVEVSIPNSLLQDPLTIKAHIGVYEGDTFKVVELVEIPVKPRKRPMDYRLEASDDEVYSFNQIENELNKCQALAEKTIPHKLSACVVFSSAYKNADGVDFISSSLVPLVNAEDYASITITDVTILGLDNSMGASRFTVSPYGVGFSLFSADERAVETVAGKAVSFEFTLTE